MGTIAAIATPQDMVASALSGYRTGRPSDSLKLTLRLSNASLCALWASARWRGDTLDEGLVIYFPGPPPLRRGCRGASGPW